jgi:hypothetical protein
MRIDTSQVAQLVLASQVKGVVLLIAVALSALVLRRGAAAARHWTWFLGMAGLLALPAAAALIPNWRVELPEWTPRGAVPAVALAPFPFETSAAAPEAIASTVVVERSATQRPSVAPAAPATSTRSVDFSPAGVLMSIWAAGAALLLLALTSSLVSVVRLARRTPSFPRGRVTELTDWMRIDMGIRRPVRVLREAIRARCPCRGGC